MINPCKLQETVTWSPFNRLRPKIIFGAPDFPVSVETIQCVNSKKVIVVLIFRATVDLLLHRSTYLLCM